MARTRKLRCDSFAAKLSEPDRDKLFSLLTGGKGHAEAAQWVKQQARTKKAPSEQALSEWLARARVQRRFDLAKASALVAEANCPADVDAKSRRAIGQAKFLAVLEGLTPKEVAILEHNEIAKDRLELDRQRLAQDKRVARRDLALDRAKLLLERAKGGERSEDLQQQIDMALEEIERLKTGEDAP